MRELLPLSLLFFVALSTGAFAAPLVEVSPRVGYRAPPFETRNISGEPVKFSAFKGRVLLVNFWASWCEPCIAEFPDLARLQASLPVTQFTVVALSQDTEVEDVANFLNEHPANFPVLVDDEQKISRAYKVRGLPVSFLVGADGVIVEKVLGPRDWAGKEWSTKVKKLIGHSK